jgi:hypothetical protein
MDEYEMGPWEKKLTEYMAEEKKRGLLSSHITWDEDVMLKMTIEERCQALYEFCTGPRVPMAKGL